MQEVGPKLFSKIEKRQNDFINSNANVCDKSGTVAVNIEPINIPDNKKHLHHTFQSAKTQDDKYSNFFSK